MQQKVLENELNMAQFGALVKLSLLPRLKSKGKSFYGAVDVLETFQKKWRILILKLPSAEDKNKDGKMELHIAKSVLFEPSDAAEISTALAPFISSVEVATIPDTHVSLESANQSWRIVIEGGNKIIRNQLVSGITMACDDEEIDATATLLSDHAGRVTIALGGDEDSILFLAETTAEIVGVELAF